VHCTIDTFVVKYSPKLVSGFIPKLRDGENSQSQTPKLFKAFLKHFETD